MTHPKRPRDPSSSPNRLSVSRTGRSGPEILTPDASAAPSGTAGQCAAWPFPESQEAAGASTNLRAVMCLLIGATARLAIMACLINFFVFVSGAEQTAFDYRDRIMHIPGAFSPPGV